MMNLNKGQHKKVLQVFDVDEKALADVFNLKLLFSKAEEYLQTNHNCQDYILEIQWQSVDMLGLYLTHHFGVVFDHSIVLPP